MLKGIEFGNHKISRVVTSSIMGHSGGGMFPLTLFPSYRRLRRVIWEADVYNLTESSTADKNIGNFILHNPLTWKYIQKIGEDGLLNAYGLTNDGVEVNAREIALACQAGYKVIPNFYPQFAKDREVAIKKTVEAVSVYHQFMNNYFWALELNYSCPNSKEKIAENIRDAVYCTEKVKQEFPWLRLIAKISYVHPYEFAQELINVGADIIHAINTIPYDLIYGLVKSSPLAHVGGGGISGGPAKAAAMTYNYLLRKKLPSQVPIIMGCGITSLDDAKKYLEEAGADVISICTVARLNSKEAEKIVKRCN
jgi:dihydroorotate dehydrogenase (NAD+) catalytic subunit